MALDDRQHVEAVAIIRKLAEAGRACNHGATSFPLEVLTAANVWLTENHPTPAVYVAAVHRANDLARATEAESPPPTLGDGFPGGFPSDSLVTGLYVAEAERVSERTGKPTCACRQSCGDVTEDADGPRAVCKGLPR